MLLPHDDCYNHFLLDFVRIYISAESAATLLQLNHLYKALFKANQNNCLVLLFHPHESTGHSRWSALETAQLHHLMLSILLLESSHIDRELLLCFALGRLVSQQKVIE